MQINELIAISHGMAKEKGWWEDWNRPFPEQIALFHTEISEALEEWRAGRDYNEIYLSDKGKPEGVPIELADLLIRVADTCGRYGIDLEAALKQKIEFNKTRPHRHGGKLC